MLYPGKGHFKWQFERSNNNQQHYSKPRRHPNDETVPMDVDPPVFTQISRTSSQANKAYTTEDKRRHRQEGRCFNCSRIGHLAKECPMCKTSAAHYTPQRTSSSQNWRTTMCKYNQPKRHTQPKPIKFGLHSQTYARAATIEEVDED